MIWGWRARETSVGWSGPVRSFCLFWKDQGPGPGLDHHFLKGPGPGPQKTRTIEDRSPGTGPDQSQDQYLVLTSPDRLRTSLCDKHMPKCVELQVIICETEYNALLKL